MLEKVVYTVHSSPILSTLIISVVAVVICAIMSWNGQDISTITAIGVGSNRDNNQTPLGYFMGPSRIKKCSQSALMSGTVDV